MWFLAPKNFSAKSVKKWPKNGQNTSSRPKKVQKCGFWPRKNFQPNWSKNGQEMAKRLYLGPKRLKNVVFGPKKIFSQIGEKMVEIWPHTHTLTCKNWLTNLPQSVKGARNLLKEPATC